MSSSRCIRARWVSQSLIMNSIFWGWVGESYSSGLMSNFVNKDFNGFINFCQPSGTPGFNQVELYQKLKKWYLIPPCLSLSIIRYGSRVKWSNSSKGVAPFSTPRSGSYWNLYTYIYIYICVCECVCVCVCVSVRAHVRVPVCVWVDVHNYQIHLNVQRPW